MFAIWVALATSMGCSTGAAAPGTPLEERGQASGSAFSADRLVASAPAVGPECCKCGLKGNDDALNNKFDMKIGASAKTTAHIACNRAYGALARKWARDASMKLWWDNKSEEGKRDWYRKHLSVERSAGDSYKLSLDVVDAQKKSAGTEVRNCDSYVPFRTWAVEERILYPRFTMSDLESKWNALIARSSTPKMWARGQWLMGRFDGVRKDDVDSAMSESVTSRHVACSDVKSLREARKSADEALEGIKRKRSENNIAMPAEPPGPVVPRGLVQNDVTAQVLSTPTMDSAWEGALWQQDESSKLAAEVVGAIKCRLSLISLRVSSASPQC